MFGRKHTSHEKVFGIKFSDVAFIVAALMQDDDLSRS